MTNCCVCSCQNSPYKCPICKQPYCSSVCCKAHKETPCQPKPEEKSSEVQSKAPSYKFPTEDTVPLERLHLLRESEEVKDCLKNPHVRDIIRAILNDPDPTKVIAFAMTEPIFVELADACLKVVEPEDNALNVT